MNTGRRQNGDGEEISATVTMPAYRKVAGIKTCHSPLWPLEVMGLYFFVAWGEHQLLITISAVNNPHLYSLGGAFEGSCNLWAHYVYWLNSLLAIVATNSCKYNHCVITNNIANRSGSLNLTLSESCHASVTGEVGKDIRNIILETSLMYVT